MKNLKVIIVDPVHPDLVTNLKKKFNLVKYIPGVSYKKLLNIISKFHIIILRSGLKLDSHIIKKANSLKVIARAGVGLDNIDLDEAKKRKINYFNIPSQSSMSVAEFAFGLLFSTARKINNADSQLRKNLWNKKDMYGFEVTKKNLGIVGLGDIGSKIAKIGKKFKMNIIANVKRNHIKRKKELLKKGILLTSLGNLMKKSDFVIIVVPLYKQTRNLINMKNLKFLKKNSILINISRGGIVNENHLYQSLRKKKFFAAATDVFQNEKKFSKLFKLDNIVVTPHIGAMTYEAQKRIAVTLEKKLLAKI